MNSPVSQCPSRLLRVSFGGSFLLLLPLATGCASHPIKDAVEDTCRELISELPPAALSQDRVIVAAVHRLDHGDDAHEEEGESEHDPLAEKIEHQIVAELQNSISVIDPHAVQDLFKSLFPEGVEHGEMQGAIERVAAELNATLLATGDFSGTSGDLELALRIIRLDTHELLAAAEGSADSFNGWTFALMLPVTPFSALWDIVVETGDASFSDEDPGFWSMCFGIVAFPFYIPISVFRSDYDATKSILGLGGGEEEHDEHDEHDD